MKIIVINPPNRPFTNRSILAEPLDVLEIATILKEKYEDVLFLDMDAKRMENNINKYLDKDNIIVFMMDYLIPLHTGEAEKNVFEIISKLDKKSKVIMISKTASIFYDKYFKNGISLIINRYPEVLISKVIDCLINSFSLHSVPNIMYKTNNEIIKTEQKLIDIDLDRLPIIDRSLTDRDDYMDTKTMLTSRGCLNSCKFCSTPSFFGKWTGRSALSIFNEIQYLYYKENTKKILFLDDNMLVDKNRIYELCNLLKNSNIKCLYGCLTSINCYDENLFKLMYEVGFRWLHFGIETGSDRILKLMHKDQDIKTIKKVIKAAKDIGFRIRNSYILDYPGTTPDDLKKTLELILDTKPDELRLHYLAYRVGTPIFYEYRDKRTPQYIHSNVPNIESDLIPIFNDVINELKKSYTLIDNEVDWKEIENDGNRRIAALVPIKYGMWWK